MASEAKTTTDPYEQFQPGDRVKHPKFGEGQILHRTGTGNDTKLVVSFAEEGEKRLMARYAKLKRMRPIETEKEKPEEGKAEEEAEPAKEEEKGPNKELVKEKEPGDKGPD